MNAQTTEPTHVSVTTVGPLPPPGYEPWGRKKARKSEPQPSRAKLERNSKRLSSTVGVNHTTSSEYRHLRLVAERADRLQAMFRFDRTFPIEDSVAHLLVNVYSQFDDPDRASRGPFIRRLFMALLRRESLTNTVRSWFYRWCVNIVFIPEHDWEMSHNIVIKAKYALWEGSSLWNVFLNIASHLEATEWVKIALKRAVDALDTDRTLPVGSPNTLVLSDGKVTMMGLVDAFYQSMLMDTFFLHHPPVNMLKRAN